MSDPVTPPPTPTPPADPFGRWAPYIRWAVLAALVIFGPRLGIAPGTLPPLPQTAAPLVVVVGTTPAAGLVPAAK
jgi:hypothetical protein